MFEKNLRLVVLFDTYGALLTKDQQNMFDLYYNEDLSLSEIADQIGISRQGVRDMIKKTEEELFFWEEKLKLAKRDIRLRERAERILSLLPREQNITSELESEIRSLLEDIR